MRAGLAALLLVPWLASLPWAGPTRSDAGRSDAGPSDAPDAGPASVAAVHPAPTSRPAEPVRNPFRHENHVVGAWYDGAPETKRDCRGCHVYEKGKDPIDPQQIAPDPVRPARTGCNACHGRDGSAFAVQAAPPFDKDLSVLRRAGSSVFEHGDHLRLACRECHAPPQPIRDPLPIRAESRSCAECHRDAGPGGGRRTFELVQGETEPITEASAPSLTTRGFAKVLDDRLGRGAEGGKFRHEDHLADVGAGVPLADVLAGKSQCTICHPGVLGAGAGGLGGQRFAADKCGDCHRDAGGPLPIPTVVQPAGVSASALTFSHTDHMRVAEKDGVCDDAARAAIADQGCHACHGPVAGAGGTSEWSLRKLGAGEQHAASSYEGCVVCHNQPAWHAPDHGSDWGRCVRCHTFPSDALADARPLADPVRRGRKARFRIDAHAHPHITGKERAGPGAKDCVACHVAPVETLRSRLGVQSFRHSTHPADCARCHGQVPGASDAASLGVRRPGDDPEPVFRTFRLESCAACHGGSIEVIEEEAVVARPPRFAHSDHVAAYGQPDKKRANGEAMTCASCHRPDASGDSFSVPDQASCQECHGHDAQRAPDTAQIGPAATVSCAKCHGRGAPAIATPVRVPALVLQPLRRAQVHDPNDTACDRCHVAAEKPLQSWRNVGAVAAWRRDDEDRHAGGDDLTLAGRPPVPSHCEGCHWSETRARPMAPVRWPNARDRQDLGGGLQLFPGPRATPFLSPR